MYKIIKVSGVFSTVIVVATAIVTLLTFLKINTAVNSSTKRLPIYCVETDKKEIAITFDAAWSADDTQALIEILNEHDAKATFFAVGDWVEKNPDAVKQLFDAGHEIANHSDTHPAFSKITRKEIREEILTCNKRIKDITGTAPKLVRAPSGDYDNKSLEVTDSLGMKMIQWDCDSLDWKKLSVDEMYIRITEKAQNGSILLFHNGIENTPKALDKILTELEKDGYKFVSVGELIYWEDYEIDSTGKQKPIQ